jgi:hypothetical protein
VIPLSGAVNEFLKSVLFLKRSMFSSVDLPFGSSLFAVACKGAG